MKTTKYIKNKLTYPANIYIEGHGPFEMLYEIKREIERPDKSKYYNTVCFCHDNAQAQVVFDALTAALPSK